MKLRKLESGFHVGAKSYKLDLFEGVEPARLFMRDSRQSYRFFPSGSVNVPGRHDECAAFEKWQKKENGRDVEFTRIERSVIWKKKITTIICREDAFEIFLTVEGAGEISDVRCCRGYFNGAEYGFAGEFDEVVNTAPNYHGKIFYHPVESFSISCGDDNSDAVGGQAMGPCCDCIALRDRTEKQYLTVGAAALPGAWSWDRFIWNPAAREKTPGFMTGGGFALEYAGKEKVSGEWSSPRFIFSFADCFDDILTSYIDSCSKAGYMEKAHRRRLQNWWKAPIYCTRHDQAALAAMGHGGYNAAGPEPEDFCSESLVEEWLGALIDHGCKPGTLILGPSWQINLNDGDSDPDKFPDMRKWIDSCHARGIRVMLWTRAWNNDHVPAEQAITRNGKAVCGDITNPVFADRFREMLRKYFSDEPDCLNADGVQVDGLTDLPTGSGLKNHENIWGLELQKRYLSLLYETAHAVKKEVCICTTAAHPAVSAFTDMIWLGEMRHSRLSSKRTFLHRAEVCRQTMPHTLINTSGQILYCADEEWLDIASWQIKRGIPAVCCGKLLRRERPFLPAESGEISDSGYDVIARMFKAGRK